MPIPIQTDIIPIFDEIRDEIIAIIHGAWGDWMASGCPGIWLCKRSRANYVWEQIIDRAITALSDFDDVQILKDKRGTTVKFLIKGQVLFRFKKADNTGHTANIPTQTEIDFHNHEKNLPILLKLPEVQRVEVVYRLNKLETAIQDICVVARDGDRVAWEHSLLKVGDVAVPLPMPEPKPVRPAAKIVKIKGATNERKRRDKL